MENDELTEKIIGICYDIHNKLGPGFNEKIYKNAIRIMLKQRSIKYEIEKDFKINFNGEKIGNFKADIVVDNRVILEIKSVEGFLPKISERQLISYLKASGLKVGLLVNFGNSRCYIRRLLN